MVCGAAGASGGGGEADIAMAAAATTATIGAQVTPPYRYKLVANIVPVPPIVQSGDPSD